MIKDKDISLLAVSIHSWLNYISTVSKSNVLAESSIRYPLTDFLERRVKPGVFLEKEHPLLSSRHVDFTIVDEDEDEGDGKEKRPSTFIELKIVRGNTRTNGEIQRIFNDLIRLALLADGENDCYFILCGKSDDFVGNFKSISQPNEKILQRKEKTVRKKGEYTKWFPFKIGTSNIVRKKNNHNRFLQFESEYQFVIDQFEDFTVELKAFIPPGAFQSQTVAIWEVRISH